MEHRLQHNAPHHHILGTFSGLRLEAELVAGQVGPAADHRARLRGEFIRRAREKRRDFTVDWVHLKLNDQAQRTVLYKDPFRSVGRKG